MKTNWSTRSTQLILGSARSTQSIRFAPVATGHAHYRLLPLTSHGRALFATHIQFLIALADRVQSRQSRLSRGGSSRTLGHTHILAANGAVHCSHLHVFAQWKYREKFYAGHQVDAEHTNHSLAPYFGCAERAGPDPAPSQDANVWPVRDKFV